MSADQTTPGADTEPTIRHIRETTLAPDPLRWLQAMHTQVGDEMFGVAMRELRRLRRVEDAARDLARERGSERAWRRLEEELRYDA